MIIIRKGEGLTKTFETVYEEALTYKRETQLRSYKTIQDYRDYFRRFMLPIANIPISKFTEDSLREWLVRDVLPGGPWDAAFRRLLNYLGVTFRYAVKRRYIDSDPTEHIEFSDYSKHCIHICKREEDHYFTTDELEQIRAHMWQNKTSPRALLALLNAEMGTRANEPVVLHWEDVGDDVIYIHRQQLRCDDMTPTIFAEVDYTKDQRCKDGKPRVFPITPRIRKILDMARELLGESIYVFHDLGHTVRTNEMHYSHCCMDRVQRVGADIARFQAQTDSRT